MRRAKISIVGAGNVGATCAHYIASKELADIVMVDIPEITMPGKDGGAPTKVPNTMPQGKPLDLYEAPPVEGADCRTTGTTSYEPTKDSDVVIVTAGIPRKPGMSRDDLIATNTKIVKEVAENVAKHSPNAVMIVVSNPLDAMVYVAWKASGFPTKRILGTGPAYVAPAAATVQMAESIIKDKKRILPCAVYCEKEYNVGGYFVGVPAVLGTGGVERIIEIQLDDNERKMFNTSVEHVKIGRAHV